MTAMGTIDDGAADRPPVIRDAHYRAKLQHRARGILDLERRVGGIVDEIDERLARQQVVRILELGCGYGTALLELRARYGRRVELHGLNRLHGDGNADILRRNGRERGLLAPGIDAELPSLAYADAAHGLPFPDDAFDLVYSQVAWLYFGNKIGVVRDVIRVLRNDGLAKIEADEVRPRLPAEYARLVEIWDEGRIVPFGDYVHRFGGKLEAAPERQYLRFGKCTGFGIDLEPVFEIDLCTIQPDWDGVKCVYRLRAEPQAARHDSAATADRGT
jgi:SAM-dependent methyltransferase